MLIINLYICGFATESIKLLETNIFHNYFFHLIILVVDSVLGSILGEVLFIKRCFFAHNNLKPCKISDSLANQMLEFATFKNTEYS